MDNLGGVHSLSPMRLLMTYLIMSLVGLSLLGCEGKESAPKSSARDRPLGLSKEHRVPGMASKPGVRAPDNRDRSGLQAYPPWQSGGFSTAVPPTSFDPYPPGTYPTHEPRRTSPSQYQGYRFRPVEPNQGGAAPASPTFGDWGTGDREWDGSDRRQRYSGYGSGYGQPSPRFRPPREQERDRWQPEMGAPFGWSPYGQPPYPSVPPGGTYGFEPGGW